MKHTCRVCGTEKDVNQFRRISKYGPYEAWNLRMCKECVHAEYVKRYTDKKNRDALKQTSRDWKTNNKAHHAEINKRWYHANKDKARSGSVLRYAIRKGKTTRMPCEVCGTEQKVQGHHDSYEKGAELDVRWLCQDHHKSWHMVLDQLPERTGLNARFNHFVNAQK